MTRERKVLMDIQQGTRKQENLKTTSCAKQQALRMLETYFGYTSFRPAQEAPIASLFTQ